jgi:hypothetical protein
MTESAFFGESTKRLKRIGNLRCRNTIFLLHKRPLSEEKELSPKHKEQLKKDRRKKTLLFSFLFLCFLFGGAWAYTQLEKWSYLKALYFSFVTLSTIGFGDTLPSTVQSKVFSILFILFGELLFK